MIRPYEESDNKKILELHKQNSEFPMIDYNKPTIIIKKTLEYNGYVVGSAFVHLTSELGLILKRDLPQVVKAKLLQELFQQLYREVFATDLDDIHVFTTSESETHFADFLIKNFGFKKDTGLVLYRGRDNEQKSTENSLESGTD